MNFYRNKRLNMNKILAGFVMAAMATTALLRVTPTRLIVSTALATSPIRASVSIKA